MVVTCSTTLPHQLIYTLRVCEEVMWPTEPDSRHTACYLVTVLGSWCCLAGNLLPNLSL